MSFKKILIFTKNVKDAANKNVKSKEREITSLKVKNNNIEEGKKLD